MDSRLPQGVVVRDLAPKEDSRGVLAEIYREEWEQSFSAVQTNVVRSKANVLRGVHVHALHADHLVVAEGCMQLGLHDIRAGSPTHGASIILTLDGNLSQAVFIPPGVAHGFYFPVRSTHVYSVSHYWNMADEMGCRFDAPELGLSWPCAEPLLSPRDRDAGSYDQMVAAFRERQRILTETAE